ncbi:MAG: inorganic pyrophosphatase [Planctomycetia bacterium]|nr:inorganic pyrophosphatase [Planctomycetia bacterium]
MSHHKSEPLWTLLGILFKSHPWHGVAIGPDSPEVVTTYIEIVPSDTIKYELDKNTGHLKVDRPQRYSNICPALYGLIPQTYCADLIGEFCAKKTGRKNIRGDGDPLDICVLTEKQITHGDILLKARPIGGFRLLDGDEADDKIIAVLEGDAAFGMYRNLAECPRAVIDRLRHYFLTYKDVPGIEAPKVEITHVYEVAEAHEVIACAQADYRKHFGDIESMLTTALRG